MWEISFQSVGVPVIKSITQTLDSYLTPQVDPGRKNADADN